MPQEMLIIGPGPTNGDSGAQELFSAVCCSGDATDSPALSAIRYILPPDTGAVAVVPINVRLQEPFRLRLLRAYGVIN